MNCPMKVFFIEGKEKRCVQDNIIAGHCSYFCILLGSYSIKNLFLTTILGFVLYGYFIYTFLIVI